MFRFEKYFKLKRKGKNKKEVTHLLLGSIPAAHEDAPLSGTDSRTCYRVCTGRATKRRTASGERGLGPTTSVQEFEV
jgi:hypothetical protein